MARFQLYYWPGLQGRGEFVRLVLVAAGEPWDEVARDPSRGGARAVVEARRGALGGVRPWAPPILHDTARDLVLCQMPLVCAYLGELTGQAPAHPGQQWSARQLALTLSDIVSEVHDTHHPVSTTLTFEDQRDAAIEAAHRFRTVRLPGWLDYLEDLLVRADGDGLLGPITYVDRMAFQLLEGLHAAFPRAMATLGPARERLARLRDHVAAEPRIAAYLESDRRLPFNDAGIFRPYPELDG